MAATGDDVPDNVLDYLAGLAHNARVRLELARRLNEQGIISIKDVMAAEQRALHDENLLKEYVHQQQKQGKRSSIKKVGNDTR
jgi:hypothetical protein